MALPKKVKKNININPAQPQPHYPYGYDGLTTPNRRKELSEFITEDGTFLPKGILHEDLDGGMLDFVKNSLVVTLDGKKIPIIDRILTIQRWSEFSQTWKFSTEDKNIELPFIVIIRNPDVQYGSNPALKYTIPDRKQFHFVKVPTWDGVRKGVDIYTIPQPVPIDLTFDVKIICNRMRELNTFNRRVMQEFTSRQAYTFVKGHYIPIVLTTVSDESTIEGEDRKYYMQNYTLQLQGFLIDEEEFQVKPAITRSLLFFDTDTTSLVGGKGSFTKFDGKTFNGNNPNHYRHKFTFDSLCSPCVTQITYPYNCNVFTIRTDNVSSITYSVNGLTPVGNLEINYGDTLTITITQTDNSQNSYVVMEDRLLP